MAVDRHPDVVVQSRRLIAVSRDFIRSARSHIEEATRRMEHARNVLQAAWLIRELRRRRDRGSPHAA
jgi:hypothetical protein